MIPLKSIGNIIDKYCGFSTDLNPISVCFEGLTIFKEFLQ